MSQRARSSVPAAPPAGRTPTGAEVQPLILVFSAIYECNVCARALLPPLADPAVSAQLGSGAAYRLLAACSWAFGAEALTILRAGVAAAQACADPKRSLVIWDELVDAVTTVVSTASLAVHLVVGVASQ